jgi:hypothetical protein
MNLQTVHQTLEKYFKDNWSEAAVPITWDNVQSRAVEGKAFVALSVLFGESMLAGLGGTDRQFRYAGVIMVRVFVPEGTGLREQNRLCDVAGNVFQGKTLTGGIICRSASIADVGKTEGWVQKNVTIPFQWDEFKP